MIKTSILLPEGLWKAASMQAVRDRMSLGEVVRQALEAWVLAAGIEDKERKLLKAHRGKGSFRAGEKAGKREGLAKVGKELDKPPAVLQEEAEKRCRHCGAVGVTSREKGPGHYQKCSMWRNE